MNNLKLNYHHISVCQNNNLYDLISNGLFLCFFRNGVGYDDLCKISPKLVFCSITGYGSKGPWSQKPGYDCVAASVGGLMNATGDAFPAKAAIPVTDLMTGMYAHGAILAALYRGIGDKIDCDLLSTQLAMMINLGSNYLNAGNIFFA